MELDKEMIADLKRLLSIDLRTEWSDDGFKYYKVSLIVDGEPVHHIYIEMGNT